MRQRSAVATLSFTPDGDLGSPIWYIYIYIYIYIYMYLYDASWKNHIVMVVAKANRLLHFIRRSCAGIIGSVPLSSLFISAFTLLLLLSVMGTSVCYQQFILS